MRPPYEAQLALRYLRFQRGRAFLSLITAISIAGVGVGTAALVIALALMNGFEQDARSRILKGSAHLQILSAGEPTFSDGGALADRAEKVSGCAAAGPVLYTPAMISHDEVSAPAFGEVLGVEASRHRRVVDLGEGDPLRSLEEPGSSGREGIVLGADLAQKLGADRGDLVRVVVPKLRLTPFAPMPRTQVLEVVGTFRSDAYPQDAQRAYASFGAVSRLLDAAGRSTWVEVRVDDLGRLEERKRALATELGGSWIVMDLLEQNEELLKALNTEKLILFLAIGLIVVVASLNIVSTLVLMVADKIREIGMLTSLGARPAGIATVFMLQGIVIGAIGVALGLVSGVAIARWLEAYRVIPLDPDVYYLTHVPFSIDGRDLVFVAVLALAVSFLATLYPAWKAARLEPVEALRHE